MDFCVNIFFFKKSAEKRVDIYAFLFKNIYRVKRKSSILVSWQKRKPGAIKDVLDMNIDDFINVSKYVIIYKTILHEGHFNRSVIIQRVCH